MNPDIKRQNEGFISFLLEPDLESALDGINIAYTREFEKEDITYTSTLHIYLEHGAEKECNIFRSATPSDQHLRSSFNIP